MNEKPADDNSQPFLIHDESPSPFLTIVRLSYRYIGSCLLFIHSFFILLLSFCKFDYFELNKKPCSHLSGLNTV